MIDEDDAVRIANDTPYGLSGFVTSGDIEHARRVAKRIRAGNVHINNARIDFAGCFGGYKQSGNGREWGEAGLEEFLELKAIFGYASRSDGVRWPLDARELLTLISGGVAYDQQGGEVNGARNRMVKNVDLFRRRLARGQRADHGSAHPCRLALLPGI